MNSVNELTMQLEEEVKLVVSSKEGSASEESAESAESAEAAE